MLKEFDVVVNCAVVKTGMHSRSVTLESAQINSLLPRLWSNQPTMIDVF